MADKGKILLAEDDLNLGMVIQDALKMEGYDAVLATSGSDALKQYQQGGYQLCILDVMMPKMDGYTVARNIRKTDTKTPIFFLTAKSQTADKIEGFRSGADDYLTKPFSTEEFLLRVEALMRRNATGNATIAPAQGTTIGAYTFSPDTITLSGPGGQRKLTKKEAAVLILLCDQINKVVERNLILTRVWGNTSYFNGRSLDVYIARLRKYLADDPAVNIVNAHGVGFMLEVS
jgi:DNA-binding response OmpR family regulator